MKQELQRKNKTASSSEGFSDISIVSITDETSAPHDESMPGMVYPSLPCPCPVMQC